MLLGLGMVLAAILAGTEPSNASSDLRIGIAQWRQDGSITLDVQQSTYQQLMQALEPLELNSVFIVLLPTSLSNAKDVDAVAAAYNVDVVVWGWYDEIAVRGYVDLANSTAEDGMTNDLQTFLERGGSTETIRVLKTLSEFDYYDDGVSFCVPRWNP